MATTKAKEQSSANVSPEAAGFMAEWREFSGTMPHKSLFAVLLAAWTVLFHFWGNNMFTCPSVFDRVRQLYASSPDDQGLGYLIPMLILGLIWWKKADLSALPKQPWWPALLGLGALILLHFFGFVVQQFRFSLIAYFAGLYLLMGLLWGRPWLKHSFFPLFLMAYLVPLPADLESMTLPLRLVSTKIAVTLSHAAGIDDIAQNGSRIIHPIRQFGYNVEAACSGLRSLTVMSAISCVFAFVAFRSPWKRLLVIASSVPLAILSNSVRLLSVVIGGTWKYDQLQSAAQPPEEVRLGAQNFGQYVHDHSLLKLVPYAVGFCCLALLVRWLGDDTTGNAKQKTL